MRSYYLNEYRSNFTLDMTRVNFENNCMLHVSLISHIGSLLEDYQAKLQGSNFKTAEPFLGRPLLYFKHGD